MNQRITTICMAILFSVNIVTCCGEKENEMIKLDLRRLIFSKIATKEEIEEIILDKGYGKEEYQIVDNTLITRNKSLAILLNRFRAFSIPSHSSPYVVLNVQDKSNNRGVCVTTRPWEIRSNIKWTDEMVLIKDINDDFVNNCIASNLDTSKYKNLDRDEIIKKYFNKSGGLLIKEYPELIENPEFIYFLIQNGFYASVNCEAGYLYIE